jgi:hypothetical protein
VLIIKKLNLSLSNFSNLQKLNRYAFAVYWAVGERVGFEVILIKQFWFYFPIKNSKGLIN